MTPPRRLTFCAALLPLLACELSAGDPKLPPAAQTLSRERQGEDPDRDLLQQAAELSAGPSYQWTAAGFERPFFGWRLPYADPARRALLKGPWRLENWEQPASGRWEPKRGDFMDEFAIDDDGDGKIAPYERRQQLLFDLELINEEDDELAWIRTLAIAPNQARRKLELVARDYVDALSGTATFAKMDIFGRQRDSKRHLTTIVRGVRESRVGLNRALRLVAEIADTAEVSLNPQSRLAQLRLIVARVGYFVKRGSAAEKSAWPSVNRPDGVYWKKTAYLILASLSAGSDSAKRSVVDDLAERVTFTDGSAVIEAPRPHDEAPSTIDTDGASAI